LEFLSDPLLVIDKEIAGIIKSQDLYITEKVLILVRKWRKTPQGDLASAILACWKPFRYALEGSPNLGQDWSLLANILTRSGVSAEEVDKGGKSLTPLNRGFFN
jgi:hypothetical protein